MKKHLIIEDIEKAIESGLLDNDTAKVLNIFLAAVNDWPENVFSLEEYIAKIEEKLKTIPNKQELEDFLRNASVAKYAWNMESIAGLLEIYQFYDDHFSLEQILSDLKIKLQIT